MERAEELVRAIDRAAPRIARPIVETLELIHRKQVKKILDVPSIGAGKTTEEKECEAVDLRYVRYLCITCQGRLDPAATASLRVHIRTSPDGGKWDDEDFTSFNLPLIAGRTVQATQPVSPDPAFLKALVENLDTTREAKDVRVWAVF